MALETFTDIYPGTSVLRLDVQQGVSTGHLTDHIVLHTGRGLPLAIGPGDNGHLSHHATLKSIYDLSHAGSPLPAISGTASHEAAHRLLHDWNNGIDTTAPEGFSTVLIDQFDTLNTGIWSVYDNNTFGSPTRVQRYMSRNNVIGEATTGATGGTSLKMLSKRENVGGNEFTAAMMDSKGTNTYYPRYGRYEIRQKMPHGQGLWPAFWLTAKSGGADMCEVDIMEYFHSQIPGKTLWTLHRTDNGGTPRYNVAKNTGGTFFEAPTYTPGWHVMDVDIIPWTASTVAGGVAGDPTAPSTNVRFTGRLNGTVAWDYVDTQSLFWTTNGGGNDMFNIYVQGCQIGGTYVGHPDDPLGYSRFLGNCVNGGTAPNSCRVLQGGYNVQAPIFGDPSSTYEVDYIKVWRYTG